ncbi:MAG: beta-galactosidase [Clostridia bacterium]|nr:beta-galactosidase [Clostridia bacterium]
MFFDEIIHGTQYYRSPTPLPEEWEGDLANMADFHLDVIQIRINWRNNELREDEYTFDDVDRLMELAEKYNKKVAMKFLLECAPNYVFHKYGGTRIGPKGEQIRGGYHGAFYGGWRPCFTNPYVQERAVKFVEKIAERYAGRKNLILWNAWNEIRNKPIEDCFCPHCQKAFGKYLERKFKTVENLNAFYGATEDSFETVALPAMAHGYWDMFEFKKFKGSEELANWLRFVYDGIRKYDKTTPIMSHVGYTSAFQTSISDVCDDYTVSKAVDFWGTSVPCDSSMDTHEKRLDYLMLHDFLRSVDENYFVHEIYPGLGMFRWYDTPFDLRFKLYGALASGARGMMYWQYRAERLGHENDCAGLMRMDGSPREVAYEVQKFGQNLKKDMDYFVGAKAVNADMGIVFDFNSMLMSEIEDSWGADYDCHYASGLCCYRFAHAGMYRLMKNGDHAVDYVGVTQPEKFKNYKVLYFPYYTMLDNKIVPYLQEFLQNGGTVIADEGFGMRAPNTWMQVYDIDCKPLMTARLKERRLINGETLQYNGAEIKVRPYKSEYAVENAETVMRFNDGKPAVQVVNVGKGKLYLCGFSLGYSYNETQNQAIADFAEEIFRAAGVEKYQYANKAEGVYEKRLRNGDKEIVFLFNNGETEKKFSLQGQIVTSGGDGCLDGGVWTLPANGMGYAVIKA